MADVYLREEAFNLLRHKRLCLVGDSNTRGLYKDLVCLLKENRLISDAELGRKLERSHLGDQLVSGSDRLTKSRAFFENREFKINDLQIEFHFITKCYNANIEKMLCDIKNGSKPPPDVMIMSSALWDITRWGPSGVALFKENLRKLVRQLKVCLPPSTLFIWLTALPLSKVAKGGFLIQQVEFMKFTLRFEVMEANLFARQEVGGNGYSVLDFHFHLRMHVHRRKADGVHWFPTAIRHMTNLVLTHIAVSWEVPLPGNFRSNILDDYKTFNSKSLDLKTEVSTDSSANTVQQIDPRPTLVPRRRMGMSDFSGHQRSMYSDDVCASANNLYCYFEDAPKRRKQDFYQAY